MYFIFSSSVYELCETVSVASWARAERSYCIFIGGEWTCWSATTESYSKKTYFFLLCSFFLSASTCHMDQFAWEPTNERLKEFGCARLEKITSVAFEMGYWMRRSDQNMEHTSVFRFTTRWSWMASCSWDCCEQNAILLPFVKRNCEMYLSTQLDIMFIWSSFWSIIIITVRACAYVCCVFACVWMCGGKTADRFNLLNCQLIFLWASVCESVTCVSCSSHRILPFSVAPLDVVRDVYIARPAINANANRKCVNDN